MLLNILAYKWNNIEIIGILAGIFIMVSFIPKKAPIIRSINFFGCVIFATYGILIQSIPVYAINGALAIIQVVYLTIYYVQYRKNKNSNIYDIYKNKFDELEKKYATENNEMKNDIEKLEDYFIDIIKEKDEKINKLSQKNEKENISKEGNL